MAVKAFSLNQMGNEASYPAQGAAAVAADIVLPGTLSVTTDKPAHRPMDDRGSLAEFRRSVVTQQGSKLRYEGDATYNQLIHFLGMGLKGSVTPSTPGGGSTSRLWTYTPSLTARNNVESYSIEFGDEQQMWEVSYAFVESFELGYTLDEVVSFRADMSARYPAKSTFTSLSDATLVEVVANKLNLWIDTTWSNLGTTAMNDLLTACTVRMNTGMSAVKRADGALEFSAISESRRHLEIDFDFVMNANGELQWDAFDAQTDRAIRLLVTGPIIEGAIPYKFGVDAIGQYSSSPEFFTEKDGENIVRFTFVSMEDASGNEMSFTVQNKETAY
jgi:hypothetical protein